jgi:ATP-dependent protease HslVU (ClpYQ) peptidase subunit
MTCIVGYVENGSIYMGGDSAGVSGLDINIREDPKVFIKDGMAFGFTSSFRMGQIIRYCLDIPKQKKGQCDFGYLCSDFMDALMDCFKQKGFAEKKDEQWSGGTFLLGFKSSLYCVYNNFQACKVSTPYQSVGCGENYAMGALYGIRNMSMTPEERIQIALEAAEEFSAGVRRPFKIVSIDG